MKSTHVCFVMSVDDIHGFLSEQFSGVLTRGVPDHIHVPAEVQAPSSLKHHPHH